MNIAFLLIPKSRVTYLTEESSFRQGMEKLRQSGYTSIPVISRKGKFLGSVSEGDLLWNILAMGSISPRDLEQAKIADIVSHRLTPVSVTASVEDAFPLALTQNFIPVIDDRRAFMGIVTRRALLEANQQKEKDA